MIAAVIIIILILEAIVLILICGTPQDDHYTIDELPYISNEYSDEEVITYKMYHCDKCRCYCQETNECRNTAHWGKYCSKTIPYCIKLGSFEKSNSDSEK